MRGEPDFAAARAEMVEHQLRHRGIEDERVLAAMAAVPRELFVPGSLRRQAYADSALPIGEGQTISQPWIVAAICQALALRGDELVLEIGTGSGYSAAVLSCLAAEVIGVERLPRLAEGARAALAEAGAEGVEVLVGDGAEGLPSRGPFDAIAVHAAAPSAPRELLRQLSDGGRLVAPLAAGEFDVLTLYRRDGERLRTRDLGPCRFVPLISSSSASDRPRRGSG